MNTNATGPVVLAVDGTDGSVGALRYACHEARVRGSDLRVVHVSPLATPMSPLQPVTPVDLEPHGRAVLQRAVRDIEVEAPELKVDTWLERDTRVHCIVEAAEGGQLLVLGRETRRGLERLLTGSTTAGVAARAQCPTVAVPDDWTPPDGTPTVVVGVARDGDVPDLCAAAYAWAVQREGTVTLVHAWELADPYLDRTEARTHADEWAEHGRAILQRAMADWRAEGVETPTTTIVRHGQPAAVLTATAADADLLMVRRAHQHRPWDHLGGTVRALLLSSPTPVEVVPTSGTVETPSGARGVRRPPQVEARGQIPGSIGSARRAAARDLGPSRPGQAPCRWTGGARRLEVDAGTTGARTERRSDERIGINGLGRVGRTLLRRPGDRRRGRRRRQRRRGHPHAADPATSRQHVRSVTARRRGRRRRAVDRGPQDRRHPRRHPG